MPVEVQLASAAPRLPGEREIQRWAAAVLEEVAEDGEPPDLCIRLVDAAESQALNHRFRGKNKPTNVLSFPAEVDVPGERLLGDLVVCAPVVVDEAQAQNKKTDDHFAHMVVHGVLHLLGHNHEQDEDARRMEALELEILRRLGVGNPYGDDG